MEPKSYMILSLYRRCKADIIHSNFTKPSTFPPGQKKIRQLHENKLFQFNQEFSAQLNQHLLRKKSVFRKVLTNYKEMQNNKMSCVCSCTLSAALLLNGQEIYSTPNSENFPVNM